MALAWAGSFVIAKEHTFHLDINMEFMFHCRQEDRKRSGVATVAAKAIAQT